MQREIPPAEPQEAPPPRSVARLLAALLLLPVRIALWPLSRIDWRRLGRLAARSLKEAFWFLVRLGRVVLERVLPEGSLRRQAEPGEAGPALRPGLSGDPKLIALGLAIPVVAIAVVGTIYWRVERWRGGRFQEFLAQAEERYALAQRYGEGLAARGLLVEAHTLVEEALRLRPRNPVARTLAQEVGGHLDRLDGVSRIYWLPLLKSFPPSDKPSRRVLAYENQVFILDRELDEVRRYILEGSAEALREPEEDKVLVRRGDYRGGEVVGELVDMALTVEGSGDKREISLLVLDRGGAVIRYSLEKGLLALPVSGIESWIAPQVVASLGRDLYLLDVGANRIWRYILTPQGYIQQPIEHLPPELTIDLSRVVDFAVGDAMYLLTADGEVLRFAAGQRLPFQMAGLERMLRAPVALSTSAQQRSVYIADAGNCRILRLQRDGRLERQFRPGEGMKDLRDLQSILADEASHRLFILTRDKLYLAALPEVAR